MDEAVCSAINELSTLDHKHLRVLDRSCEVARLLRRARNILVIADRDGDGVCSALLLCETLRRLNQTPQVLFERNLTQVNFHRYTDTDLFVFLDLGSGDLDLIRNLSADSCVIDHHPCDLSQLDLSVTPFQKLILNPHLSEIDGGYDWCTGLLTALVSYQIDPANQDLMYLGLISAISDSQLTNDLSGYRLIRHLAGDTVEERPGILSSLYPDLQTTLECLTHPFVDQLSGDPVAVTTFLRSLSLDPKIRVRAQTEAQQHLLYETLLDRLRHRMGASVEQFRQTTRFIPSFKQLWYRSLDMSLNDLLTIIEYFISSDRVQELLSSGLHLIGDPFIIEEIRHQQFELARLIQRISQSYEEHRFFYAYELPSTTDLPLGVLSTITAKFCPPLADGKPDQTHFLLLYQRTNRSWKFSARCYDETCRFNLSLTMGSLQVLGGSGGGHRVASGGRIDPPSVRSRRFCR